MDEKTARKYRRLEKLPSKIKQAHMWRTRQDPYCEAWDWGREHLEANPGFEAKTLLDEFQRQHPGRYADGRLRTQQRRIKTWPALEGLAKEIFFPQEDQPGEMCQSDFTRMHSLEITPSQTWTSGSIAA
jgi:hypothetical protein